MVTGMFLEVFGMFMTSLGSKYWQILLSQGICVGLGSGLLALTSLAILPLYFVKRRLLAGGIAATGSGLCKFDMTIFSNAVALTACSRNALSHHDEATIS